MHRNSWLIPTSAPPNAIQKPVIAMTKRDSAPMMPQNESSSPEQDVDHDAADMDHDEQGYGGHRLSDTKRAGAMHRESWLLPTLALSNTNFSGVRRGGGGPKQPKSELQALETRLSQEQSEDDAAFETGASFVDTASNLTLQEQKGTGGSNPFCSPRAEGGNPFDTPPSSKKDTDEATSTSLSSASPSSSKDRAQAKEPSSSSRKQRPRTAMALFEPLSPKSPPLSPSNPRAKTRARRMPSQSVDDVSSSGSPLRRPSKQPLPSGAEKSRTSLNSEESRLTPGKRQPWSQDNVAASTGTTPSASPAKERSGKRRDASYSLRDVSQHSAARLMAYARSATHNFNLQNVALRTSCVIFVDQSRYRTSRSLLSKRSMRIPEECSDTMSAVEAPWQHQPTRVWIHIICAWDHSRVF